MILCTTTGYQTRAFVEAAGEMGLEAAFGSDRCHVLEDPWRDGALPLRFEDPQTSALQIVGYAQRNPVHAIVALGDGPVATAARACQMLGLPFHTPRAADVCRNKYLCRERLRAAALKTPKFGRFPLDADPRAAVSQAGSSIGFPCVLKPLALSASRGVIRANDATEFIESFERIGKLLHSADVRVMRDEASDYIQVEEYVEGIEIAAEGIVIRGEPRILAIFDKPDPLEGPFFEETIYVTPSRLPGSAQDQLRTALERAIKTLGLFHGPFHAELRINCRGVWPLEIAARSIGGLCSRALRFCSLSWGGNVSLERVIVALALGEDLCAVRREERASGVMMIPVGQDGIYESIEGVNDAREVPGVEDVIITAKPAQRLVAWPEGCSYPGFIFARGSTPEFVESALRAAHSKLRFCISAALPVI